MSIRPTGSCSRVGPTGSRRGWLPVRLGLAAALCGGLAVLAGLLPAQRSDAASGGVLFGDDFEPGFGKWSTTSTSLSGIHTMTSSSPSHSLFVRGTTVTTTSIAIDARVPALRVRAWLRRGSDAFSVQPGPGEDLVIGYLDSSRAWVALGAWPGSGSPSTWRSASSTGGGASTTPSARSS